jgi:hypothetical protein
MLKPRTPSLTESPLPFAIDPTPLPETLTAFGGVPLVVQAFRSLGLPGCVQREVQTKVRQRGYDEATFVESFVVLNAVGGECLDDFARLREDPGLAALLGHGVPSPEAARKFLSAFHDARLVEAARGAGDIAYIPEETAPLQGLGRVNRALVQEVGRRCPDQRIATIDQDATIIESHKQAALRAYKGERGYQPMLAVWAEMNLVVADEFREGNVPANMAPLTVAQAAFAALPPTVEAYAYRSDSACHEHELVDWLRDPTRVGGPRGVIQFGISARMSPALHEAVQQVAEAAWIPYGTAHSDEIRDCANVAFVPGEKHERKDTQPLRYVAIRIRKRQGDLFDDGALVKHFAVLSNRWDLTAPRLIEWHREKAGTIEGVHDVLKNELAAGVLPCKYFGANAAWLRLAVLSHNVLTALKRLALPAELLAARPKRLRFLIFSTPGRVVQHARRTLLRLALPAELLAARPKRLRFLIFSTPGRVVQHARRTLLRLAAPAGRIAEWLEAWRLLPVPA